LWQNLARFGSCWCQCRTCYWCLLLAGFFVLELLGFLLWSCWRLGSPVAVFLFDSLLQCCCRLDSVVVEFFLVFSMFVALGCDVGVCFRGSMLGVYSGIMTEGFWGLGVPPIYGPFELYCCFFCEFLVCLTPPRRWIILAASKQKNLKT